MLLPVKSNTITKRPVGGGFLAKTDRNENIYQYYLRHPKMTHANLARIFKVSRARVTQILSRRNKEQNENSLPNTKQQHNPL